VDDDTLAECLWNGGLQGDTYQGDKYQVSLLEQYKIYVEMADRVSARRGLTNTFFLTLNTGVLTLLGVFWKDRPQASTWVLLFPLAVLVTQCMAWYWILRSHRQLNSARYRVIGLMEAGLPAAPYAAEWQALGEGKDRSLYWPVSHLEQWVPALFVGAYVGGFLAAMLT
jgi:hypothetical protein